MEDSKTIEPWFDYDAMEWLREPRKLLTEEESSRLIAAAPDVINAGKHLFVKLAEVYQATGQKISDCQAIRDWLAAVAKAEGR